MAYRALKSLSASFLAAAAVTAACLAPQAASAQNGRVCDERATLVETLQQGHGESQQARMVVNDRQILELFANEDTNSWTILETSLQDEGTQVSCLNAAGNHYQDRGGQEPIIVQTSPSARMVRRGCAPHENMVRTLQSDFGEQPQYSMLTPDLQYVFHIYASDESRTWTITRTQNNGISCMLGSGTAFEETKNPKPAKGELVRFQPN